MNFTIQYSFDMQTGQYIASVPELDLSDYGETIAEAENNLRAMIALYFEEKMHTKGVQRHEYA